MPLYIPWLTEGIKKRGVRYLLHHYLGQFFEEKLTLEQLSIDIYEGKGSIRNLALDVDGLNDELDFIPFRFLEGCLIGQISVEVPWSSLATDACKVELDGAKFYCRLKTSADATKPGHCSRSALMTSSMQMAEEIVTTEDDDESENPMLHHNHSNMSSSSKTRETGPRKKDANQMFEGLEMFAQLIDSVLRRTKLTAYNTLFQIKPYHEKADQDEQETTDSNDNHRPNLVSSSRSSGDEFSEPLARSGSDDEESEDCEDNDGEDESEDDGKASRSKSTVEFFIKFFRCEEMIDQTRAGNGGSADSYDHDNDGANKSLSEIPETITKLLTLEDVEMRIDGIPVSNLVGKHTITIKFNGQKSEISIFSGSPLLAVISHKQLDTFFNVFDSVKNQNLDVSFLAEKDQKLMSPEDYAKIENQLLESATMRNIHASDTRSTSGYSIGGAKSVASNSKNSYYNNTQVLSGTGGSARRWVGSGDPYPNAGFSQNKETEFGYHSHFSTNLDSQQGAADLKHSCEPTNEPTLNHIEAFSCELKLPGIWLCIVRSGQSLPALIKPFADSINSFQSINKYIDGHIKVPHIRLLALKVALDVTALGTNVFLGDLDISEYLEDASRVNQILKILNNDQANVPMSSSRYKASITNGGEISVELLTKTRVMFDPTIIDRIVDDYKLIKLDQNAARSSQQRANHSDLTIRADKFKLELLCPIPDLTPEASIKRTQLRPQSFIFDFADINMTWRADRLKLVSNELTAFVKTQPKQLDSEAVKFIESTSKGNDKIELLLEPSPSNLDNDFTHDIEQALNESSMYDSIYISQAAESKIPTEPFQTKRKVVRASFQSQQTSSKPNSARISECDHEKIITPGDRQHLLEYLEQTVASTKLSLNLHLPVCEVEFEDKEQLDLIYNRFGNDFVFWRPQTFVKDQKQAGHERKSTCKSDRRDRASEETLEFKPVNQYGDQVDDGDQLSSDADNEGSEGSYHSISRDAGDKIGSSDPYDNEVTCKIVVDELLVRFNHQSCAAALKQSITADNLLLGVVIDVNKKPNTFLSLVTDNLELSNELETVLEGNLFCNKKSTFSLTAEIKRPTKALKNIKLAIQLRDGLFDDIRAETYSRFWQSIDVTDEPILGYVAPQIITELHVDILNTSLLLVRDGARPALLSIDELYMTSMVMEQTSQVMIRLIADEVSLYMKRDRQGLEVMKNYICLIDSGLIDVDFKFGGDRRIEFGVINNVITLRVCQDSLSALFRLFNVIVKSASANQKDGANNRGQKAAGDKRSGGSQGPLNEVSGAQQMEREKTAAKEGEWAGTNQFGSVATSPPNSPTSAGKDSRRNREMKLLVDAMNDYTISTNSSRNIDGLRESGPDEVCGEQSDRGCNKDKMRHNAAAADGDRARESSDEDDHGSKASDQDPERDYDSDAPPVFQRTNSAGSDTSTHDDESSRQHKPNACLLDESNPTLANLFSQPLMPTELNSSSSPISETTGTNTNRNSGDTDDGSRLAVGTDQMMPSAYGRVMDESGFFVIGDDDIGAGIIDKKEHEPLVRKLISEPINIVENHFKMKRPRTIPEALFNCVERYVLEEMTVNINLFGGRDFDDENVVSTNDDASSTTTNEPEQVMEATNELLDTIGSESQLIRSRTGSMACGRQRGADFNSGSLKRNSLGSDASSGGRLGGRRKHLSEGSGTRIDLVGGGKKTVEQRVRFGEGAVNLWESLDLMSAPDFLGSRHDGPNQPILSADSKHTGGTWRENDVCIQLTLTKVKLLYEIASTHLSSPTSTSANKQQNRAQNPTDDSNGTPPISWRFMLFVQDIEVKDRIAASDINKMLYEYCNESMPKRSTQMLTIKNVATINPSDGCEECDLRVALKPLRLNIDQDTLLFLLDFFTTFCKSLARQQSIYAATPSSATTSSAGGRPSGNSMAAPLNPAKQQASSDNSFDGITTKTTIIGCKPGTGEGVTRYESAWRGREGKGQPIGPMRAANSADRDSLSSMSSASSPSSSSSNLAPFVVGKDSLEGRSSAGADEGGERQRARPSADIATGRTKKSPVGAIGVDTTNGSEFSEVISLVNEHDDIDEEDEGDFADGKTLLPTHCHTDCDPSVNHQPIYIKSFTFSPDVPIRIDYHTKRLNFEQGALAGILMGLADLDHSELILRRVHAKHGMRGLERVLQFAINFWLNDIKRNQLPSILGGVGPMHSVIQLFQGLRDLVWMPIDHYRKDGRLVRGLQRGASSFSSSTAMAAINLVNRFISIVQCTAQIAHDIVTPPTMGPNRSSKHRRRSRAPRSGQSVSSLIGGGSGGGEVEGSLSGVRRRHHYGHSAAAQHHHQGHLEVSSRLRGLAGSSSSSGLHSTSAAAAEAAAAAASSGLNQPRNFCEGVAVGFTILREGLNDTARNVTVGMQAEDVRSAVGELVRQIPSTLLNPIISATEGAQSVLVGIRNQIAPDARRDDQEKWKGRARGK